MKKENARWIALLFDAEGHFSLNKGSAENRKTRKPRRGFTWGPHAGVINTSMHLLEQAKKLSGDKGHLAPHGSELYRSNNKQLYTWTLRREEMIELLPQLISYLIVKKEQAELLLEAAQSFDICKGLGLNPVTQFRDRRLETVFWRMRYLNAKTRDGPPKVLEEEKAAGHIPYNREEWLRDSKAIRESQDRVNYENQLATSREWKRRNKRAVSDYWQKYYVEHKVELNDPAQRRGEYEKIKQKMEADPIFAEAYRAKAREAARRYREKIKVHV